MSKLVVELRDTAVLGRLANDNKLTTENINEADARMMQAAKEIELLEGKLRLERKLHEINYPLTPAQERAGDMLNLLLKLNSLLDGKAFDLGCHLTEDVEEYMGEEMDEMRVIIADLTSAEIQAKYAEMKGGEK